MEAVKDNKSKENGKTAKSYILIKPFEWEGKTYTEFAFNFEGLKGTDLIAVEDEITMDGGYIITPEISTAYMVKLAARAAGVGSDVVENLPVRDFIAVKNMARDFLISTDLER